jgi:hypothetical protein
VSAKAFPHFSFAGSHAEIGRAYGAACAQPIRDRVQRLRDQVERATGASWEASRKQLARYAEHYRRYCPHILDEIDGIAAGAEISLHEALLARTCWDLLAAHGSAGCTAFVASGAHTVGGSLIGGQNKDVPAVQKTEVLILELHPSGYPASINYAYFGMCEGPGMNDAGLMRFETATHVAESADAVPVHLLKRLLQESMSIAECEEWLRRLRADRLLGMAGAFTMGDASGRVAALEIVPGDYRVYEPPDGLLAHANHLLHPDLQPLDRIRDEDRWVDSLTRQPRMLDLMRAASDGIDAEHAITTMLADGGGAPGSICRRQDHAESIAGIVCVPAEGRMLVTYGLPSDGQVTEYTLRASVSSAASS